MLRRSILVAVALLVPVLSFGQDNAAIAKQIEANERAVNAAVAKGDLAGFKALVADDAVSGDGAGFMPVSEFEKEFNQIKVASFNIDQVNVKVVNPTTAIVTYHWTGKGTMMGQPIPGNVMASSVWVNKAGKWQVVFHQETVATPPPPATPAATKKPAAPAKKPGA